MKNNLIFILFVSTMFSFSQEEKENYKQTVPKFIEYYNEGHFDSIFYMFDDNMMKVLPLDKTLNFFEQNVSPAGKINEMDFYKLKQTAHVYKTTFENVILDVLISLDDTNHIIGLMISQPESEDNLPKLERNITKMISPFKEECFVFWGGTTVEQNYHVAYKNQKYAYDILMVNNQSSHEGDSKKNENYYIFGKDIMAICDAKVVKVIDGVDDNIPGDLNPQQLTGNTVIIETQNKEFILYAHLKKNSIIVKEGEDVKKGDIIGKCGNSGNTTEPHLHLSLQNVVDMNIATGAKLYFDKLKVNGEVKEDYLPVKEDKIQNIKL